jgi:hypothetical protein
MRTGLAAQFRESHEFYVKGMHRFLTISLLDKGGNEASDGLLARTCIDCAQLGADDGPLDKELRCIGPDTTDPVLTFALTMEQVGGVCTPDMMRERCSCHAVCTLSPQASVLCFVVCFACSTNATTHDVA